MSAASAKGTVGVVGLGIMGGAIAKNLVAAGWRVVGYDIDAARTAEAKAARVETVANATAVAATAETIITSLPTPAALDVTVQATAAAKAPRRVVVEASTFSLDDKASTFSLDDKARAEAALRTA